MEILSRSVKETEVAAATLAQSLVAGDVIALHGKMGAGKTQFVRGLVKGFQGDPRRVSSPTFVLLNVYPTPKLTVFHLDAYRVHGPGDFEGIGFLELLEEGGVVVVEWPSRVGELIPARCISVHIETIDPTTRKIRIER